MSQGRRYGGPGLRRKVRIADHGAAAWTPASLTGVYEWWRGDLGITESTGVSAWAGQVGGKSLAQGTEANRPSTATRDSQTALLFNGTSHFMQVAYGETLSQPNTRIVVAESTGGSGTRYALEGDGAANQHAVGINASLFVQYAGSFNNGGSHSGMHAQMCVFNGASSQNFADDFTSAASTGDAGAEVPDGMTVGANVSGSANFWTGYIWEVIEINGAITEADKALLGSYLDTRYAGLTLTY